MTNLLFFKSNIWIQLFDLHGKDSNIQKTLDMQRDTKILDSW
jgi:hypothetical protein